MELRKLAKPGLMILGMALAAGSNIIQSKLDESAMKKEVAKAVDSYCSSKAKES